MYFNLITSLFSAGEVMPYRLPCMTTMSLDTCSCYWRTETEASWMQSFDSCEMNGGKLATMELEDYHYEWINYAEG